MRIQRQAEPPWTGQADVVVVGGGIRGIAIAYCLSRSGVDVALLERHQLLAGASGANLGYVNVSTKEPAHYAQLSLQSQHCFENLADELDADIEYHRCGWLNIAETDEDLASKAEHDAQQSGLPGICVEILSRAEARSLEPALSPHVAGATFCPQDGVVNPLKLGMAYVAVARRLGARVYTETTVQGIRVRGGRVTAVRTDRGTIHTSTVVNAAGIWAAEVGRMVEAELPVVGVRGQVAVTGTLPPLISRPVSSYVQTEAGNLLLGTTHAMLESDRRVEYGDTRCILQRAARVLPALNNAHIIRIFAAARPWPIDGLPIMGSSPEWPEGFVCAVGHSGITLAPITGQLITELVTGGSPPSLMKEYGPARFGQARFMFPMAMYRNWSGAASLTAR